MSYKPYIDYEPITKAPLEYKPGQVWCCDDGEDIFEIASTSDLHIETVCGVTIPKIAMQEYIFLGYAYIDVEREQEQKEEGTETEVSIGSLPAKRSVWINSEGGEEVVEEVYNYGGDLVVETNVCCYSLNEFFDDFELVATAQEVVDHAATTLDMVNQPNHYMLFPRQGIEVKDICKAVFDNMDKSNMSVSSYEAGYIQQAMQYLLRFPGKGQWQDIEKCIKTLQFAIDSHNTQ